MNVHARLLAAFAVASLAACSGSSSVVPGASNASQPYGAAVSNAFAFAPYVDTSSWPPFSFHRNAKATGTRYYTMAFVQSYQNDQCEGAWGATVLPGDPTYGPYYAEQVAAIRKLGGDAIVSFGGASGQELGQECADATSLEAAYQTIVDKYGFTSIDFDIEGADVDDLPALERRSQAMAALQAHYAASGKTLAISLTLPVNPWGMPGDVLNVVKSALQAGVKVGVVNVMTMDYGDGAEPHPAGHMGEYAIDAVKSSAHQLASIGFPLGANSYASIGVTPMIGQNDVKDEVFELSDAAKLFAWAKEHKIGRISFWAAQRDKECAGGANSTASDVCSGIVQKPGAFSKLFSVY